MTRRCIRVSAPSRLHFGLLAFGHPERPSFGGAGVMLGRPGLQLRIAANQRFETAGPSAGRVREFAERWQRFHGLAALPSCRIEVLAVPPQHSGLGVGTQLGLAVAAGLERLLDCPPASPAELALSVGRASRSSVGTHGFVGGGFIVDRGKLKNEPLGPLECRLDIPAGWRFVLIRPAMPSAVHGVREQQAFGRLPSVPRSTTERLERELREKMVPAVAQANWPAFSESVFRSGYLAGSCFASEQGGAYNGSRLQRLVDRIRSLGVAGVGQSSWGPTLFAVLPDQEAATQLVDRLQSEADSPAMTIAPPDNRGARVWVTR